MADPTNRDPLPFEPKSKKKKVEKKPPPAATPSGKNSRSNKKPRRPVKGAIPEVVSGRMLKRMALFSGIPTSMAMLSFVAFYLVVSQGWLEVPNYVAFAVSLLFFGLGVVGLSYGIFSSSWEDAPGGFWGWPEFRLNLGRTLRALRRPNNPAQGNSDN